MKKIILALLLIGFLVVPIVGLATIEPAPEVDPLEALDRIINVLFTVLVVAAVIFIIVGAFSLLTAQGDADKIDKGRQQILYAIIAVVVAILARGLVDWIRGLF